MPRIARGIKAVAAANSAQFLDLRDELQGHEFCSKSVAQGAGASSGATSEWGRFLNQQTVTQGELQEAFHPNAYAQQATGTCLTKLWAQSGPAYACTNVPGQGFGSMNLTASP